MIVHRNKIYCTFYEDCIYGKKCPKALRPQRMADAIKFFKGNEGPIAIYAGKPDCFVNEIDILYNIITSVTGITKKQIQGISQLKEPVFARQLFHWAFVHFKIGTKQEAAVETGHDRNTARWSIKAIENLEENKCKWRNKLYQKFMVASEASVLRK